MVACGTRVRCYHCDGRTWTGKLAASSCNHRRPNITTAKNVGRSPCSPNCDRSWPTSSTRPPRARNTLWGTGYRQSANSPSGWRNCNLRTQFLRIIKRAGLKPWPRLFHNLRANRETELAKAYPIHVVTAWLGNTPRIALKHYLQVTDADFERAAASTGESGAEIGAQPAQNAAIRGKSHETKQAPDVSGACAISPDVYGDSEHTFSGEDRIRTCGPGFPSHRFSKPALSTTQPPLQGREIGMDPMTRF